MEEKELKEFLARESPDFKRAFEEHQRYEKALETLMEKPFLTDEEKLEEKELKKKKLILKDRMYQLMFEYRKSL
jgi:uncharacterized protein YdcH (DUF465 family)